VPQRRDRDGSVVDLAFVIDHPAQHFSPGLAAVEQHGVIHCVAVYWNDNRDGHFDKGFGQQVKWDIDLLQGYPSIATDPAQPTWRRSLTLLRWFARNRPRVVVIAGWAGPAARLAILWCKLARTPHYFEGDTTWQHTVDGSRPPWHRALVLRALFLGSSAIATGTFNREFYILHGMHPSRIIDGVIPIDTTRFAAAREQRVPTAEGAPLTIGFAGKLIEQKGVGELLDAVAQIDPAIDWRLRIVGDGPLRGALEAQAVRLGIDDRVDFGGFVNQQDMPATFAAFDLFVAPSKWDLRILAVAEAMAAGAPVIVSDATGIWGAGDLVQHGTTGMVYESGDAAALARTIEGLARDPAQRAALRAAAAQRVEREGPQTFVTQLETAATRPPR
jgi:glycosyltransferase involved in cell wall biosynthesis